MQERSRRTEETILLAVALEFHERGYAAASYASVATRAGVPKSLVQYHAASKADLAAMVVKRSFTETAFLGQHVDTPARGVGAILDSIVTVGRRMMSDPFARAAARLTTEAKGLGLDFPKPYVGWIAQISAHLVEAREDGELQPDTDEQEVAWQLVASFTGMKQLVEALDAPSQWLPERAAASAGILLAAVGLKNPAGQIAAALNDALSM